MTRMSHRAPPTERLQFQVPLTACARLRGTLSANSRVAVEAAAVHLQLVGLPIVFCG